MKKKENIHQYLKSRSIIPKEKRKGTLVAFPNHKKKMKKKRKSKENTHQSQRL
jgi:hypothetical protein